MPRIAGPRDSFNLFSRTFWRFSVGSPPFELRADIVRGGGVGTCMARDWSMLVGRKSSISRRGDETAAVSFSPRGGQKSTNALL
jgi:hypothetical protein